VVNRAARKPVIGILGGLASGKSTVAAELAKLGCAVVDADKIAHEALDNKRIRDRIVAYFGRGVLDQAGRIDHRKLAEIVFADSDKLSALNGIVHPYVLSRAEQLIDEYMGMETVKAVVLDMPLLVEVGWANRCDRLIFVDCPRHHRRQRARKMGICDENEFRTREKFQISLDRKAELADNIIENNSGLSELSRQVADIFSQLVRDHQ